MATAPTCVFHISIDDETMLHVGLSEEEFDRVQTPTALKQHVQTALKYINAGAEPKYEPVVSRVVARFLIENELVDQEVAKNLIKHQSHDRFLQEILQAIGGKESAAPVQQSDFRKTIQDISTDDATRDAVTQELKKYLSVLQGGTASLDRDLKERVERETGGKEKRLQVAIQVLGRETTTD